MSISVPPTLAIYLVNNTLTQSQISSLIITLNTELKCSQFLSFISSPEIVDLIAFVKNIIAFRNYDSHEQINRLFLLCTCWLRVNLPVADFCSPSDSATKLDLYLTYQSLSLSIATQGPQYLHLVVPLNKLLSSFCLLST